MRFFLAMLLGVILWGCSRPIDTEKEKQALLETDRQFSQLSEKQGTAAAFYHYLADDGLALPFNGPPRDKNAYAQILAAAKNDTTPRAGTLTWAPDFADVATSGDLGYTWGQYTFTFADSTKPPTRGYYVTVWKKQADGSWRFVFDAGNQVSSPEEEK